MKPAVCVVSPWVLLQARRQRQARHRHWLQLASAKWQSQLVPALHCSQRLLSELSSPWETREWFCLELESEPLGSSERCLLLVECQRAGQLLLVAVHLPPAG